MKFWYMFDNHTFADLGENLDAAIEKAKELFEQDPWGSVFSRDEQLHSHRLFYWPNAHGHGKDKRAEFLAALEKFRAEVLALASYDI